MAVRWLLPVLVGIAAVVPYLSTLHGYFLSEDFAVVSYFARRPLWQDVGLVVQPWTGRIFGLPEDELIITGALSYQLDALLGPSSPLPYHATNLALHLANALLVMATARAIGGVSRQAASFAGALFAVLPIHAESVAWISGRVDSLVTLFFLGTLLAYAHWRERGSPAWYWVALLLGFLTLYSKASGLTLVLCLAGYEALLGSTWSSGLLRRGRALAPFAALTGGYLVARLVAFGQAERESRLPADLLHWLGALEVVHLRMLLTGRVAFAQEVGQSFSLVAGGGLLAAQLVAVILALWARARDPRTPVPLAPRLVFFGPFWWLLALLPLVVTYESPRHLYLASTGLAVGLACIGQAVVVRRGGRIWGLVSAGIAVVLLAAAVVVLESRLAEWNAAAALSGRIAQAVWEEVGSAREQSLVILAIDAETATQLPLWEYALPYALRPPFMPADLTRRVHLIAPASVYCCPLGTWASQVRANVRAWSRDLGQPPVTVLCWDAEASTFRRVSSTDRPGVRSRARGLARASKPETLNSQVNRLIRRVCVAPAR